MPNYREMSGLTEPMSSKKEQHNNKENDVHKELISKRDQHNDKGKNANKEEKHEAKENLKEDKVVKEEQTPKDKEKEEEKEKEKEKDKDKEKEKEKKKPVGSSPVKEGLVKVTEVKSDADFDSRLKKAGDTLIVVDFYATWCAPCRMAAPQLDRMAGQYRDVIFLKVDVDEVESMLHKYSVSTLPTFVFIKQGNVVETIIGFNMSKLEESVKKYKDSTPASVEKK